MVPAAGKCQAESYECGYRVSDTELESVQSQQGVITSRIRDFDQDGEDEILVLIMNSNEHIEEISKYNTFNVIYMRMYELKSGEVVLRDEVKSIAPVLGMGEKEASGIFLKEHDDKIYICGSVYHYQYLFYDAYITVESFISFYDGQKFVNKAGLGMNSGNIDDFRNREKEIDAMAEVVEEIGMEDEAEQMRSSGLDKFEFVNQDIDILFKTTGTHEAESDMIGNYIQKFFETYEVEDLGKVTFSLDIPG